MSRYTIPARQLQHTCVVGYDPPLGTFFAQVYETSGTTRKARVIHWVGTGVQELLTVSDLATALQAYAVIPADVRQQLESERQTIGFRPNFGTHLVQQLQHLSQEDDA
jgi:hypothetical protein